jgi:GDP-mannose 6-dehydrogenase
MLPGSTDTVVIPTLESASGKREGESLTVGYNPEFMREGSSVRDFFNPPRIVFGTRDSSSHPFLSMLYSGISAPTFHTSIRSAEFLKYVDNAFHALKVAFANEIGMLSRRFGIDSHEVMRLFCADTLLNISPAYLTPGFAFGGSCLPKDLRALTYAAKTHDAEVPLLGAILLSNENQIKEALGRIHALKRRHIGFFGLSFKPLTDDLRESPIVYLVEHLVGKGFSVRIYDESISPRLLMGSNRRYIEKHLPHFMSLFVQDSNQLVEKSEVIVFCHKTPRAEAVLKSLRPEQSVLDLARVMDPVQTLARYEGISW